MINNYNNKIITILLLSICIILLNINNNNLIININAENVNYNNHNNNRIPFLNSKTSYTKEILNDGSAPVVKLNVFEKYYLNIIIGNPGKYYRLMMDFSCDIETVILFNSLEDNSQTFTEYPPTIIAYFGPILIRLPYVINPLRYNPKLQVPYQGYLCMGYQSALWNYWSRLSLSPYKLVLGEFDKTLARISFEPFELKFAYGEHLDVLVNNTIYKLYYCLENEYSIVPRELYHGITNVDLKFDHHLHFDIDADDIKIKLITGFDKTLIRKSSSNADNSSIVLGKQFSHNFAHYINYITRESFIMPSFDQFSFNQTEPYYTNIITVLLVSFIVLWLGTIFVRSELPLHKFKAMPKLNINASINSYINANFIPAADSKYLITSFFFSTLEIYAYITVLLLLLIETNGYAYHRHINFIVKSSSNIYYTILNTYIVANAFMGLCLTYVTFNTYRYLKIRRLFFETSVFLMLWLVLIHICNIKLVYVVCLLISAIYTNMRMFQFYMHFIFENIIAAFICGVYAVIAILFFIFYNVIPFIQHFFYGFDDHLISINYVIIFTIGITSLILLSSIPLSIFRNTIIDIVDNHMPHLKHNNTTTTNNNNIHNTSTLISSSSYS